MTTTTREVILRIKSQMDSSMGRTGQAGFKDFAGLAPKITKQVKDLSSLLPTANKLWLDHAKAIGAAATALQKYNSARTPKEPMASRPGSGGSGGGTGGMGFGGLGRFAPHALALSMGALYFNEARSAAPALWGQYLHGGPVSRGAFPFLDSAIDTITGRDQREKMEDILQAERDRNLRGRGSMRMADFNYRQGMYGLQRSLQFSGATPQEHIDLLGRQHFEMRSSLGNLRSYQQNLASRRDEELASIEKSRRSRLAFVDEEMAAQHPVVRMAQDASELGKKIPWKAGLVSPPALLAKLFSEAVDFGPKLGKSAINQEEDARMIQTQLEYAKKMQQNLEEQERTLQAILANEQQQLELARSIAQQRGQGIMSYGQLSPTEQRAAIDAAKALQAGQTISRDEESLLSRAGPYGQKLLRNAYGAQGLSGYGDFLQAAGAPSDEIQQLQRATTGGSILQGMAGALGAKLPTIEVTMRVDEALLAQSLAKELGDAYKDLKGVARGLAEQLNRLETAQANQNIQRSTSTTGAALGRAGIGGR